MMKPSPYRLARLAVLARRCRLVRAMRRGRWKTYLAAVAIGLTVGNGVGFVTQPAAPIQLLDVREVDGAAVLGRRLDLLVRIVKRADCNARVVRWLWQHVEIDGRMVPKYVPLKDDANPPVVLNTEVEYILSLAIPADVQPGVWFYTSQTFDGCAWGSRLWGETVRKSPNIPVRVVAPSPNDPPAVVSAPGPVTVVPAR